MLFITQVLMFYNYVFLFVDLTTLGTFNEFLLVGLLFSVQPLTVIYRRGNLVY